MVAVMSATVTTHHHATSPEQVASLVFAEHVGKLLYGGGDDASSPSTPQLVALTFIHDHPGTTIKALAAGIRVNHSAASQQSHKLAADGLIEISPGADRRQATLKLSIEGGRLLQRARERRLKELDRIFRKMSPADRQALVDGLTAFLKQALHSERNVDDVCGRCWVEHFGECIVNLMHRQMTGRDTKRVPAAV